MAQALNETAAQPQGSARVALAQQALSLAQVLLAGGGISSAQYQDAVSALQAAGASPASVPPDPLPFNNPPPAAPDHGHGDGDGGQGAGPGGQN
jgi:hypothetical protein